MNNLSAVAKIVDSLHSTPTYAKTGLPMVRVTDIHNDFIELSQCVLVSTADYRKHIKNHKPQQGDIVITRVGSFGMMGRVEQQDDFCLGQNIAIISPYDTAKDTYVYYFLRSPFIQRFIFGNIGGSAYKSLSLERIRNLPYFEPEGSDAKRIGDFLYKLDKLIEIYQKINRELEHMAKTLYDYWFVQFDFPDANGQPYKSSGGKMVYNERLKRAVPEGWNCENMFKNTLCTICKPKIDYFQGSKRYIATADVDQLSLSRGNEVTYSNRESRANMQPRKHTVWFAKMKNSIKHILVGEQSVDLLQDYIFSTGFMGLQADETSFEYIASVVHHPYFEAVKDFNAHGATMAGIGNNDLKNIKLLVPDPVVLRKFHILTKSIFAEIDMNRQKSQQLASLRDLLLPLLMNGQVKITAR